MRECIAKEFFIALTIQPEQKIVPFKLKNIEQRYFVYAMGKKPLFVFTVHEQMRTHFSVMLYGFVKGEKIYFAKHKKDLIANKAQ